MVADYVGTKVVNGTLLWAKPRHLALLRAVRAYIRANSTATGPQVNTYANTLAQVLEGIQNSAVLGWWLDTLKMTPAQGLAWVRSVTYEPVVEMTDPDAGYPVLTAAQVAELRIRGDRTLWGIDRAADFTEHPAVRDAAGNVIEERISGTIDGVLTTVRRTISVALVDGAYVATPGAWEIV